LINSGATINVIVRIEYVGCSVSIPTYTDITIPIATGQQFGTYVYTAAEIVYCAGEGCIGVSRTVVCYVDVNSGGGPLPSTIALDSSLTILGLC